MSLSIIISIKQQQQQLTKFRGDFELSGSSAANIADDNMMQTNIMFPNWL